MTYEDHNNDIELGDPGSLEKARVENKRLAVEQARIELEAAPMERKDTW